MKIKIRENRRSFRVQEWKQTTNRQELKEIKTQRGAETVQEVIHKVEPRRGALQENGQAAEAVGSSGGLSRGVAHRQQCRWRPFGGRGGGQWEQSSIPSTLQYKGPAEGG